MKRSQLDLSAGELFSRRFEFPREEDAVTFNVYGCSASRNGNQGKPYRIILREPEERIKIFRCERS